MGSCTIYGCRKIIKQKFITRVVLGQWSNFLVTVGLLGNDSVRKSILIFEL